MFKKDNKENLKHVYFLDSFFPPLSIKDITQFPTPCRIPGRKKVTEEIVPIGHKRVDILLRSFLCADTITSPRSVAVGSRKISKRRFCFAVIFLAGIESVSYTHLTLPTSDLV